MTDTQDKQPSGPTLGELLLGTEGLALLRLAFAGDSAARRNRIGEIRALLARLDGSDTEGAEYAAPLAVPEYDTDTGYALWSETYDAPLRLFGIEEPPMHALFDTLPASRVLDAACGTGRHSAVLAQRGHAVTGVDASPAMLARARDKVPGGTFLDGELTALPVDDNAFDAAVCALALVHLPDLDRAVAELARAVRPGGRIVISDVHPTPIQLGWQAQFRTADGGAGFMRIHAHPLSDYASAFAAASLRIRTLFEPKLTEASAMTAATERLPEANRAAWVGLPGVVVWDLEKPL